MMINLLVSLCGTGLEQAGRSGEVRGIDRLYSSLEVSGGVPDQCESRKAMGERACCFAFADFFFLSFFHWIGDAGQRVDFGASSRIRLRTRPERNEEWHRWSSSELMKSLLSSLSNIAPEKKVKKHK